MRGPRNVGQRNVCQTGQNKEPGSLLTVSKMACLGAKLTKLVATIQESQIHLGEIVGDKLFVFLSPDSSDIFERNSQGADDLGHKNDHQRFTIIRQIILTLIGCV